MKKHHKLTRVVKAAMIAVGLAGTFQVAPVQADSVHKAQEGDTFYLLSQKYNVNLYKLMSANPSIEATNIYAGLDIIIPDGDTNISSPSASSNGSGQILPTLNVYPENKVVEAWGKTFNYSKTIDVKASAYSSAASENGIWGAVDYFGNPLKLGTIAVDPKVIPMGTKVLVTGHSHPGLPKKAFVATATDQGGAIKGNRIDIFIPGSPQSVSEFGYQNVKLYVLE